MAGQGVANYCDATMFKLGRRMGIRSRSALISAVFRKAMALDMSSAHAGQLQVTCDVCRFYFLRLRIRGVRRLFVIFG